MLHNVKLYIQSVHLFTVSQRNDSTNCSYDVQKNKGNTGYLIRVT